LGKRTKGRQLLVQSLYAAEISGNDLQSCLDDQIERRGPAPDTVEFVRRLAAEIVANKRQLDGMLKGLFKNWDPARVGKVEQAIFRLALAELCYHPDVPARVVLDESCELARLFCGEESVGFVNGVLDRAAAEILKGEQNGKADATTGDQE